MATILALVARHLGKDVGTTPLIGVNRWLGFSATVGLTNNRFSREPLSLWGIDAGYQLASGALMGVVLDLWP